MRPVVVVLDGILVHAGSCWWILPFFGAIAGKGERELSYGERSVLELITINIDD